MYVKEQAGYASAAFTLDRYGHLVRSRNRDRSDLTTQPYQTKNQPTKTWSRHIPARPVPDLPLRSLQPHLPAGP